MRWNRIVSWWAASLASLALPSSVAAASVAGRAAAADTTVYHDPQTGFTFSQYVAKYSLDNKGIVYRVATPSGVPASTAFDVVVQIVAGNDVGWAGLAWGGGMISNPLAAAWGWSSSAVISSRWAQGHYLPQPYNGAQYEVLHTGTHTNGTHWQVTAKCTGCTSYTSSSSTGVSRLNARGSNRLAFAYSATKPTTPSSNLSDIGEHSVIGFWNHDFSAGANAAFSTLVAKNAGSRR